MKNAVLNMMKCTPGSIIASNRIARHMAMQLGCTLIDSKESCFGDYDRIYVVNGPMLYCNFRTEMAEIISRAKDVVWIENDYAIQMPGFIKARAPAVLSACENFKGHKRYHYVNWNQLTFFSEEKAQKVLYSGVYYYGAYRKDREAYFYKYLNTLEYDVHISSGKQAMKKFHKINPHARFVEAGNLFRIGGLGAYQAVIYIEDKRSHKIFTSPANRFYEALSAHTLQFFDKSSVPTFAKAGLDISPWVVDSPAEVAQKMSDHGVLRREQLATLRSIDFRSRLAEQIKTAVNTLA